jgi:hypothetical protein
MESDACTLPTAERPLRLAEFDALFRGAVREVADVSPTHTRMRLAGPPGLEATVRDLTARESACCSFFTFTVEPSAGDVTLGVEVPPPYAGVLAALTARAREALAGRAREDLTRRCCDLPDGGDATAREIRLPTAGMRSAVVGRPDAEGER